MNDFRVRNEILQYHLSQSKKQHMYTWMGTWVVRRHEDNELWFEDFDPHLFRRQKKISVIQFLSSTKKKWIKTTQSSVFTVCLLYDVTSVHYVTFVYDPKHRRLLSFDPGVELYHHGQKTIVPMIRNIFASLDMIEKTRNIGTCHSYRFQKKSFGIQFNGNIHHVLPADAFCQSWTLFFLIRLFYQNDNNIDSFVTNWCRIKPRRREMFLSSQFLLPTLLYFPRINKRFETMLPSELRSSYKEDMIHLLEQCFFTETIVKN
jgi:hypothetical protein